MTHTDVTSADALIVDERYLASETESPAIESSAETAADNDCDCDCQDCD